MRVVVTFVCIVTSYVPITMDNPRNINAYCDVIMGHGTKK